MMIFTDALANAKTGRRISRPGRPTAYLTYSPEKNTLILFGPPRPGATVTLPCVWMPTPGDLEATDWIVVNGKPMGWIERAWRKWMGHV